MNRPHRKKLSAQDLTLKNVLRLYSSNSRYYSGPPTLARKYGIEANWFMTTGPGRYARPSMITNMERFLSSNFLVAKAGLAAGQSYTVSSITREIAIRLTGSERDEMIKAVAKSTAAGGKLTNDLWVRSKYFTGSFQQYDYDKNNPDYIDRVGVWNSMGFIIGPDTLYQVNANGTGGSFSSMQLRPTDQDFDFGSDDLPTQISNGVSSMFWGGEKIDLIMLNTSSVPYYGGGSGSYGSAQYWSDESLRQSQKNGSIIDASDAFYALRNYWSEYNSERSERTYASLMKSIGGGNLDLA